MKREEEINQQSQELVELRKNYSSESEKVRVVRFLSFLLFFFESDEIVKTFKKASPTRNPRVLKSDPIFWLVDLSSTNPTFTENVLAI